MILPGVVCVNGARNTAGRGRFNPDHVDICVSRGNWTQRVGSYAGITFLSSKPSLPGQLYVQMTAMVSNLDSHLHCPVLRVCPLKVIYSFPKIFKPPPTNCWLLAVCRINPQLTRSPNSSLSWSSTPTFCPVSECGALPHSNVLCFSPVPFPVSSPSCSPPAPAGEILFSFEAQE